MDRITPWLRRTLLAVFALIGLAVAAFAAAVVWGRHKANRCIDVPINALVIKDDARTIERGRYLYASRGCAECHGANATGHVFIDDPGGLRVGAPGIGPGPGSVAAAYRPEDWERAIRHGVKPNGRPLAIMPSEDYNRLTDADTAAIAAYLQQLPPQRGAPAVVQLPLLLQALYGIGVIRDAAEKIDQQRPPSQPVPDGLTVAHGAYVANMCLGCHGLHLSGGRIPGAPPAWPPAANLTPGAGSAMLRYANARGFVSMLRTGKRPDGSAVSSVMPFGALGKLNDVDAGALFMYLKSLAPRAAGGR